jgi:hypothetical protein
MGEDGLVVVDACYVVGGVACTAAAGANTPHWLLVRESWQGGGGNHAVRVCIQKKVDASM